MNECDPGNKGNLEAKNTIVVVGESGAEYPSAHIDGVDKLVVDREQQPTTLAEGE